jgi:uncharacterized repeat protein (TIGR03803 family)
MNKQQQILGILAFAICFILTSHNNCQAQSSTLFYGVTLEGGSDNQGVIFHIDPNTGLQMLDYSFSNFDGNLPIGSLVLYNGKFYGVTFMGGDNDFGVIFEWYPTTRIFTKKIDFDLFFKGGYPSGVLTLVNGKFYGMTEVGGAFPGSSNIGLGVIFEWDPANNNFIKKIDFD